MKSGKALSGVATTIVTCTVTFHDISISDTGITPLMGPEANKVLPEEPHGLQVDDIWPKIHYEMHASDGTLE